MNGNTVAVFKNGIVYAVGTNFGRYAFWGDLEDGTFDFKRVYSYNSKGDITSYRGIDQDEMVLFLWEYENTYNEKNELIKVKSWKLGESIIYTDEYTYDGYGNITSKTTLMETAEDATNPNTAIRYEWWRI